MFVSSYNTYITHKSSSKAERSTQKESNKTSSFSATKSFATKAEKTLNSTEIPLNYISSYKSLHNQQLLQQQNEHNKEYSKTKFDKINKITTAQSAYSENSKLFSLLQKPKTALTQEVNQPKNIQQSSALKQKFINTYIENDNYYKVTAA